MRKARVIPGSGKNWESLVRRWVGHLSQSQRNQLTMQISDKQALVQASLATPYLLEKLTSYACSVTGKKVECQWGDGFYTDLESVIVLDPNYPPNAPMTDRKIVLDSRLEHELRGHWQYTPSQVFDNVYKWAANERTDSDPYWGTPNVTKYRGTAIPLFNILEDGRVETRLRWSQPGAYRIIAAGDLVCRRWSVWHSYRPAARAYSSQKRKLKHKPLMQCPVCGAQSAPEGIPCEACFTVDYRWEQISGLLLTAAIPPHLPPLPSVEQEVREVFDLCSPHVLYALRGTAADVFDSTRKILRILIEHNMVPLHPKTSHLTVNDARGQPDVRDTPMSAQLGYKAGFSNIAQEQRDKNAQPKCGPTLEYLAVCDMQDYDFANESILNKLRESTRVELAAIEEEQEFAFLMTKILVASGLSSAGPGLGLEIYRTDQNSAIYQLLKSQNKERGQRLAREIRDLMVSVLRPERFLRIGRLDCRQLVNALARRRDAVFVQTRPHFSLDLAMSILVDVSRSMSDFNHPFPWISFSRGDCVCEFAQLADAVVTCTLALDALGAASEVRAFGGKQWLVKGFYDPRPDGLGGLPGIDNGGTVMAPAIHHACLSLLGRDEAERLMVVMTDADPFDLDGAIAKVRLSRSLGIRVLGILFANNAKRRTAMDLAMARIFGPGNFTVIHSLDAFSQEVGRAIKRIVRK